ncbi:hypothetical protein J6590_099421 [Homalodisca vitripennis]|nr:hypothetical protein J6590_099421 [Homalodisca vitripennis]
MVCFGRWKDCEGKTTFRAKYSSYVTPKGPRKKTQFFVFDDGRIVKETGFNQPFDDGRTVKETGFNQPFDDGRIVKETG